MIETRLGGTKYHACILLNSANCNKFHKFQEQCVAISFKFCVLGYL